MPQTVTKEELLGMTGHEAGPTEWLTIDQDRVNLFADATDDHQFIHVDPEKAAATPFGGTVAHGFLTLALLVPLSKEIAIRPENALMTVNYGLNKVRFPQPVRVGSRIRMRTKVLDVEEKKGGRVLVTSEATIEIEGQDKPAVVAESLMMYVIGG